MTYDPEIDGGRQEGCCPVPAVYGVSHSPVMPATHSVGTWRWLPVASAAAVWCVLLALTLAPDLRRSAAERFPWMLEPLYHDWHVVRIGWQAHAAGVDPLASAELPYNYPRFVLLGGSLGGATVPPNVAGLILAALFLGVAVWILRPATRGEAVAAAAFVASPPVWLLLERGNLDAVVFILLAPGLWFLARRAPGPLALAGGSVALFVAAALKLFPAVILVAAIAFWRGARARWSLLLFVAFAAWLLASLDEVAMIMQKTTRGLEPAYGRMQAGSRYVAEVIAPHAAAAEAAGTLRGLMRGSLVIWLVGAVAACWAGWRMRDRWVVVACEAHDRVYFWSGALIFAGTFLLGSNWSYRLVFLLFCVPFLWHARRAPALRWGANLGLAGVGLQLLAPFHLPLGTFLVHQAAAWVTGWLLLAGAMALLTVGNDVAAPSKRR